MITISKFKEYIYERWDIALAPFLHLELDEEEPNGTKRPTKNIRKDR